jgi:hypothetical protein
MARRVGNSESTARPVVPRRWKWPYGYQTWREETERLDKSPGVTASRQPILESIRQSFFPTGLAAVSLYLTDLAHAVAVGASSSLALYNELDAEGTRLKYRTLKKYPGRIETMADEIERINAAPFFASEFAAGQHADLPVNMRLYAQALRRRIETPRSYMRPILYLTYRVKEWTGNYQDAKVATLLQECADVLGRGSSYDALTLAQARYRHRKARAT